MRPCCPLDTEAAARRSLASKMSDQLYSILTGRSTHPKQIYIYSVPPDYSRSDIQPCVYQNGVCQWNLSLRIDQSISRR